MSAEAFESCLRAGGVVVFPADTVYGLACDAANAAAIKKMYALKGRPPDKPAAVMFFRLQPALAALPELGSRTRAALVRLLPGAVTLLVPNPRGRFPLACVAPADHGDSLGLRVPEVPLLARVRTPVLQSSANHTGGADPRLISEVPGSIRAGADMELDGGELPGTPSTVVDLRRFEASGSWTVVRAGAVAEREIANALRDR